MAFLQYRYLTQGGTLTGKEPMESEKPMFTLTFQLREAVYLCPKGLRPHEWSLWVAGMKGLYVSELFASRESRVASLRLQCAANTNGC